MIKVHSNYLPPLTTVAAWAENVRSFFFSDRNNLEILSENEEWTANKFVESFIESVKSSS